ncbi:TRAP transporter large permease [Blautia schinkii]|nr:TRAP transporter large permease [Blautia schinkii]
MFSTAFIVFLLVFVFFLFFGAPIYLALLCSGLSYVFLHGGIDNMAVMAKMYGSLDNFVLLAIPMFMMAGKLMNNGGITDRIFGFCRSLLGHFPGGLAYVNVLASFVFSGMSGSALADVGGLGAVEIKAMRDEGYEDDLIFGITAASSTMGPIVPPSIPMVIYGAAASVSVGTLFMAGVGPGVVIAAVLSVFIYFVAKKRKYPVHKRCTLKEIFQWFRKSFWALLMIAIILGGISGGFFTPTEASCIAIAYCIFAVCVIYRDMPAKTIIPVISETVQDIVPAMAIVASASLFGWVLQFEHLGTLMLEGMLSISSNKWVILLMIDVILLFFGMILDSTPTILLLVPIFQPLVREVGISEIHLGIVVVLNLMIGLMTPPYGQSLFMLSGATKTPFNKVVSYVSPWLIPLFIALLIVTFFPEVCLFVPRMLGMTV